MVQGGLNNKMVPIKENLKRSPVDQNIFNGPKWFNPRVVPRGEIKTHLYCVCQHIVKGS
jgi:hypothetical protein